MKIKVRKEIVQCSRCNKYNEFLYLSDFSYGERLVLYDNRHKYAYINFFKDKIYDDFIEILTSILKEKGKITEKAYIQRLTNMIFSIACDKIQGTKVDFNCNKRCFNCNSDKFEDLLVESEKIVIMELPVVTHREWISLTYKKKKENIIDELNRII